MKKLSAQAQKETEQKSKSLVLENHFNSYMVRKILSKKEVWSYIYLHTLIKTRIKLLFWTFSLKIRFFFNCDINLVLLYFSKKFWNDKHPAFLIQLVLKWIEFLPKLFPNSTSVVPFVFQLPSLTWCLLY